MTKKSIVTGASGFIGSRLVHELLQAGHTVAALGRRPLDELPALRQAQLKGAHYLRADLDEIIPITNALKQAGFHGDELHSVFHLAWSGATRLSDLDVAAQYRNVTRTLQLYQLSAELAADRFIFCGTMEEAFAAAYTRLDHRHENKHNRHVIYALAKIAARNALKLGYRPGQPDLLFGTNSHVMGPEDDKDSFLQVSLQKLIKSEDIIMSTGEQNFDVINVADCARAYVAIAEKGLPGQSYWVGSGHARPLKDYVLAMAALYPEHGAIQFGALPYNDITLDLQTFAITNLRHDTGFEPTFSFEESVKELATHLASKMNTRANQ